MELRHRSIGQQQSQRPADTAATRTGKNKAKQHQGSGSAMRTLLLLVGIAAGAATAYHLQLAPSLAEHLASQLHRLQGLQHHPLLAHPLLSKLTAPLAAFAAPHNSFNGTSSTGSSKQSAAHLITQQQLAQYKGSEDGTRPIYMAILGQVFDVSAKPEFYGPGGGYAHFAGTDGSKSFITGDFVGDVTDDVSSLEAEACMALVGWLDFYHKTYPYVGKLIGRFYDSTGAATTEMNSVHERAKQGEAIKAARADEEARWPSCNSRWTENEGGVVWCDHDMHPRKLFVSMKGGKASWRCACFKELGWSDVRKVYAGCKPDAHSCSTNAEAESANDSVDPTIVDL